MDEQSQVLTVALSRDVVRRVAPDELSIFGPTSRAYFAGSAKRREGRSQDEVLGFGIEDNVVLLTPVILSLCHRVLVVLADETAKGLASGILAKLKAWSNRKKEPQAVQFSQPELQHVREVAERAAGDLHLPAEQIRLLTNAVVGSLATSPPENGSG